MAKLPLRPFLIKIIVAASIVLILMMPFFIYHVRLPVLIVADNSSVLLYGETRIRSERRRASLALFRKVSAIIVADNASDDIIRFAVSEVSASPYNVIFPLRYMNAARLYRENNPKVPVVLLEGRHSKDIPFSVIDVNSNDFFIYKTDINTDFQRIGMAASVLDMGKNGKIAVFMDQNIQQQAKDVILQAVKNMEIPLEIVFFSSFSQFYEIPDLSCAVLAGTGIEFLENNQDIPVILLSWIDLSLLPDNVAIIIDDSPWIQAVHAVRMVKANMTGGLIKSKFIINKKNINKETLHKLIK
jgi:hypothetical protein